MKSHETRIQNRRKDYIKKYRLHVRRYLRKMLTVGGVQTVYGVSVGVETGFFAKNDTRDVTHIYTHAQKSPDTTRGIFYAFESPIGDKNVIVITVSVTHRVIGQNTSPQFDWRVKILLTFPGPHSLNMKSDN